MEAVRLWHDGWLNRILITEVVGKGFETTADLTASEKNIAYTPSRPPGSSEELRRRGDRRCLEFKDPTRKSTGEPEQCLHLCL